MTVYNVAMTIVALVDADSAEAAIGKLTHRVHGIDADVYEDGQIGPPHAFESEELDDETWVIR